MGNLNCVGSPQYVAKETFHPDLDAFNDLPPHKDDTDPEKHAEELKKEKPLKLTIGGKLRMIVEETELLGPGGIILYKMKSEESGDIGLAMADMVAKIGTVECEKWFFGMISRPKAVEYLQFDANVNGSFLIRNSERKDSSYALSLKAYDKSKQNSDIQGTIVHKYLYKHYLIPQNEDKTQFWIKGAEKYKYSGLSELVQACKRNEARGLACLLTEECIKPRSANKIGDGGGKWDIPRSELTKEKELGGGHFGIVYKGTWRGQVPVAIKQLRDDRVDSMPGGFEQAKAEFFKEAKIFRMLNHPYLVQVYAICVETTPFLLVTELLENGDLKNYLKKEEAKQKLTFDKLVRISENIASGIAELHRLGVVHRDLAARNIMLDKWFQAKVGDFGLAREGSEYAIEPINEDGTKKKMELPWKWVAPEAATHKVFNEKSDVWAFGVILWEIFTFGAMPYPTMSNQAALMAIQQGYRMEKPNYPGKTTPENLNAIYNVMLTCWNEKQDQRPPMSTLQQDLDDFGPALVENKYDYSAKEYMDRNGLTNHAPRPGRTRKPKAPKQHDREAQMGKRVRRKQQT